MTSLVSAFHNAALRYGNQISVSDSQQSLTYLELDKRSSGLARRLIRLGVQSGDYIGVIAKRNVETVVGMLAVLKAGGAYVPLDPTYPPARLRYLARDANLEVVVGDIVAAKACGFENLNLVEYMGGDEAAGLQDSIIETAGPDTAAYVIYTSGSTGDPKGCIISHGNVLALLEHTLPLFRLSEHDRWSVFHSFSFDFSVWELWGALVSGGTAICVPDQVARSADDFLDFLKQHRITVLNQVPSAFRALAAMFIGTQISLPSLRYVIFGGEGINLDIVAKFHKELRDGSVTMVNMYGLTEATVHATVKILHANDFVAGIRSPIGVPLTHLAIDLREENGQVVPPGTVGEMWISGKSLAAGYLNRPLLTAERFKIVDTPRGPRRCYRTGDLARVLLTGELEYIGRNDDQVKIRGYRIELGEIAALLRDHPAVIDAEAAVIKREGIIGNSLIGCVVPVTANVDQKQLDSELRTYMSTVLPKYMIPDQFRVLSSLPLNPSGKLDRPALERLAAGKLFTVRGLSSMDKIPAPEAQSLFCSIFSSLLEQEVEPTDNFFNIGGNSLLAVDVVKRAQTAGLALRLRDVFAHPTPAELATITTRNDENGTSLGKLYRGEVSHQPFIVVVMGLCDLVKLRCAAAGGEEVPDR